MKRLFLILFTFMSLPVLAQAEVSQVDWPVLIVALLIAVAEVVLRLVPDPRFTGLIGVLINLLKVISDYLNRKK